MRILILTDFFPNDAMPHEGIFVYQLVRELRQYAAVTIITPRVIYPPLRRYRALRRSRGSPINLNLKSVNLIKFRYLQIPVIGEWITPYWFLLKVTLHIIFQREKFDLIHAFWAYRSGFWGNGLKRLFQFRLIVTLYGSDINYWLYEKCKGPRIKSALRNADAVISVSRDMLEKTKMYRNRNSSYWIPIGVDCERFRIIRQTEIKFIKKKVILCVANFYFVKGVDLLIRAVPALRSKLADFQLDLVGDGPERDNLQKLAGQLQLQHHITYHGRLDNENLPDFFNKADVLVIPSRNEGWPTVIFEALACGTPVVGTKVGGIPEALQDNRYGILVEPESPTQLAEAIYTALTIEWDKRQLRNYAEQYSWPNIAEQMLGVYQSIQDSTACRL